MSENPKLVTLAEYARIRGVHHSTVSHKLKRGLLRECIIVQPSGRRKLILEIADREWEQTFDAKRSLGRKLALRQEVIEGQKKYALQEELNEKRRQEELKEKELKVKKRRERLEEKERREKFRVQKRQEALTLAQQRKEQAQKPKPPAPIVKVEPPAPIVKVEPRTIVPDVGEADPLKSLADARTQKEYYDAQLRKIKYEKEKGDLLEKREVHDTILKLTNLTKEAILNIPDKFGPELLAIKNLAELQTFLRQALNDALEKLGDGSNVV